MADAGFVRTNAAIAMAKAAFVWAKGAIVRTNVAFVRADAAFVRTKMEFVRANVAIVRTKVIFVRTNAAFVWVKIASAMCEIAGKQPFCPETGVLHPKPTTPQPNTMAKPLAWNAPAARGTSELTWNGTMATPKTLKIKASIDFTQYTASELPPVAQTIHNQMTLHAAHFPSPPLRASGSAFSSAVSSASSTAMALRTHSCRSAKDSRGISERISAKLVGGESSR